MSYRIIGVWQGWLKNKADGHLQEKNCSNDQQPTRSCCFSPAEIMVDSEKMKVWIKKAWRRRLGGLGRRKSVLVYDALEAHTTDTVIAVFKRKDSDLANILGRLTSIPQPLDVSLNKPFKDGVRKRWMQWMADFSHEFMATGQQKKPSEELLCSWILQAFPEVWHHEQFGWNRRRIGL